MNVRRSGLGRGLGALIPTGPADEDAPPIGARFEEIPVGMIDPNPKQPRDVFDEEALNELITSIKEVGVLQPVVVREVDGGRYQLIMGERRLRASKAAGVERVPAIVRETTDDNLLRDALLENLHRQQLNPLEEAAAYQQLLEEFGATHEELADRFGRSRSHVSNTLRLMNLSAPVQRRVAAGVISAGHARALLALDDVADQDALATRIVAEGLSVRAVEEIVTAPAEPGVMRAPRAPKSSVPGMDLLAAHLADRLETRVKIQFGKRNGKLIVEFANVEDLQRIVATLAPGMSTSMGTSTPEPVVEPKAESAAAASAEPERYEPAFSEQEERQLGEFGHHDSQDPIDTATDGQSDDRASSNDQSDGDHNHDGHQDDRHQHDGSDQGY